jgi:predicted transcriptional regulator
VSFAAITLCVASQRVFIVVSVYIVIDSVRKLLDTPSYVFTALYLAKHRVNSTFTFLIVRGGGSMH